MKMGGGEAFDTGQRWLAWWNPAPYFAVSILKIAVEEITSGEYSNACIHSLRDGPWLGIDSQKFNGTPWYAQDDDRHPRTTPGTVSKSPSLLIGLQSLT